MRNKGSAKKPLKWALLFIGIDVVLALLFDATSSHPAVGPAILFGVAALIAAILILVGVWRLVFLPRRKRPGYCGYCGYCLTGLTEARCPECGTDFDSRLSDQEDCVYCGYCLAGLTEARCPECGTVFASRLLEQEEGQETY